MREINRTQEKSIDDARITEKKNEWKIKCSNINDY